MLRIFRSYSTSTVETWNLHPISEQLSIILFQRKPEWISYRKPNDTNTLELEVEQGGEKMHIKVDFDKDELSHILQVKRGDLLQTFKLTDGQSHPWQNKYLGNFENIVENAFGDFL